MGNQTDSNDKVITPRQRIVMEMVLNGYCNKEIAQKLGISVRSVKYHLGNLYKHMGMPVTGGGYANRQELLRKFGEFKVVWVTKHEEN